MNGSTVGSGGVDGGQQNHKLGTYLEGREDLCISLFLEGSL